MSKRPRADLPRYAKMIGDARRAKKLTQAQLGKLVGLEETTIRKYENAQRVPAFDEIFNICAVLDLNVFDVMNVDLHQSGSTDYHEYVDKPFIEFTNMLESKYKIFPLTDSGYTDDAFLLQDNVKEKVVSKMEFILKASAIRRQLQEKYKKQLANEINKLANCIMKK